MALRVYPPACRSISDSDKIIKPLLATVTALATATALAPATGCSRGNDTASPNPAHVDIGVGFGVGIPLLLALGTVVVLLVREKKANRQLWQRLNQSSQVSNNKYVELKSFKAEPQMLFTESAAEMQGTWPLHELSGDGKARDRPSLRA